VPRILNTALVLSEDEQQLLPRLAKRLGCTEESLPQRLLDLALDQFDDLPEEMSEVPSDGSLPLVRTLGEIPPAQPAFQLSSVSPVSLVPPAAPVLEAPRDPVKLSRPGEDRPIGVDLRVDGIDASGRHPDVPLTQYRHIDEMPCRSEKDKRTLRRLLSRRYLHEQREYELERPRTREKKQLPLRVVWSVWGSLMGLEQEITWDHLRETVQLVAGQAVRSRQYKMRHPKEK
jgi:hypothetical protein